MLLAHSAKPEKSISAQSYADHVHGVVLRAMRAAEEASFYSAADGDLLRKVVRLAAEYHDLGKLDSENQAVLAGERKARHLPVQHTDAGTAYLVNELPQSAALVRSHHIGLPDFVDECNRSEDLIFRDESVLEHVNRTLEQLLKKHASTLSGLPPTTNPTDGLKGNSSVFFRLALSCLVDGDHTDTAINYGGYPETELEVKLRPKERLSALDNYINGLEKSDNERSFLREQMYHVCRDANVGAGISSCDSPVGTGKTTAVMAHLLAQARQRGLRRIIVVLPFTNIITQSVDVYRKALLLPGEKPEDVVAELHHRADFQDAMSRHLIALWKAPIIVTTAVTFFETLASNTPSTLRRLHNLPGSAIFVDESHAALPAKLLPLAWFWMKRFADEWKCYWVLASGSLNRFWQISEFDGNPPEVPEILPADFRVKLSKFEINRISYKYNSDFLGVTELVDWLVTLPGPRIVILNTVQSAAIVAKEFKEKFGREGVEHLSTALTPRDRKSTLHRVKARLENRSDVNWVLIATSCVEAGIDISFRTGVREIGSLVSLLQTAGRVKRHGGSEESKVWSIRLSDGGLLKINPGLKDASHVLTEYCEKDVLIKPSLCTDALKREIRLAGNIKDDLQKKEDELRFPMVEKEFRVIDTDTRITVVDDQIIKKLESFEKVDWRAIQDNSVQIWGYKLDQLRIKEIRSGLYGWTYPYDNFLGYMAGVIPVLESQQFNGAII